MAGLRRPDDRAALPLEIVRSVARHDHRMDGEDRALPGVDGYPHPMDVRAAEGLEPGEVRQQLVLADQRLVELEEVRVAVHEKDLAGERASLLDQLGEEVGVAIG